MAIVSGCAKFDYFSTAACIREEGGWD